MTKEETLKAIEVMKAYTEGKTIQVGFCGEWNELKEPIFDFTGKCDYRIKPEPHYRPFESAEEVMEAIKEHGDWVRYDTYFDRIVGLANRSVNTVTANMDYCTALNKYRFLDDTPFGKLVEE